MATKQPSEIAEAAVESGVAKAHLRWDKVVVGAFLAGAYWVFAFLGNLVGAVVFVATSYWYLYLRPDPATEPRPVQRGA